MKLKRLLVSCVAVAMTVSLVPAVAFASEAEDSQGQTVIEAAEPETKQTEVVAKLGSETPVSGTCGKNLKYNIDVSTGKMTITGSGAMYNYAANKAPWNDVKAKITSVAISGKLTSIGAYAFKDCTSLTSFYIPGYVTSVGTGAFYGCKNLKKISGGNALKTIGSYAFKNC